MKQKSLLVSPNYLKAQCVSYGSYDLCKVAGSGPLFLQLTCECCCCRDPRLADSPIRVFLDYWWLTPVKRTGEQDFLDEGPL